MTTKTLFVLFSILLLPITAALATSNYEYGPDEYVTISTGISPDGKYAITAHGSGELGDDNFHLFLTDAISGKRIGPLEEIVETLDTGAGAFAAKWSEKSSRSPSFKSRSARAAESRFVPHRGSARALHQRAIRRQR